MSEGSTNRNSPSKRRSRRRTSVTVRQATRLASSPARGTHAGHGQPLGVRITDVDLRHRGGLAVDARGGEGRQGERRREAGGGPTSPGGRRRGS